ncbi:hypothetical protein C1H76_7535 [Elsinoe australis]|uniref:Uncharacterized protein n=1 Tax=Elsinoe australis TaxID=40998 RepID=A0A4V6DTE8_9PEZI|nr:hypothetical protein C1H76_7535 [Elsinoe australis]
MATERSSTTTLQDFATRLKDPTSASINALDIGLPLPELQRNTLFDSQECLLLTKILNSAYTTIGRVPYLPDIDKRHFALVAQGAISGPHMDAFGLNTHLTVNLGVLGFL